MTAPPNHPNYPMESGFSVGHIPCIPYVSRCDTGKKNTSNFFPKMVSVNVGVIGVTPTPNDVNGTRWQHCWDVLASFLDSGRKWRRVSHLHIHSLVKTNKELRKRPVFHRI